MEQDPFFKTRTADRRKRLKEEADEARDLAERLRDFTRKYRHGKLVLTPGRLSDLAPPAQDLEALASFLEEVIGDLTDRGGPPPRLRAFKALAAGLIRAYRRATGKRGTGHGSQEGRLRDLVEAVLPTASAIAKQVTGKPLRTPSEKNLGEQLDEIGSTL